MASDLPGQARELLVAHRPPPGSTAASKPATTTWNARASRPTERGSCRSGPDAHIGACPAPCPDIRHPTVMLPLATLHAPVPTRSPPSRLSASALRHLRPAIGARRQPTGGPERYRGDTAHHRPPRPGSRDLIAQPGRPPAEHTAMPQGHKGPRPPGTGQGEDGLRPEQYDLREAAHTDGVRITRAESAFGTRTGASPPSAWSHSVVGTRC
jgi:hypothetical protein